MTFDDALNEYQEARARLREIKGERSSAQMHRAVLDKKLIELARGVTKAESAVTAAADKLKPELEKEVSSDIAGRYPLRPDTEETAA